MLPVAVENLVVALVGLALLLFLGAGLCTWLPPKIAPYRWLVAPWVGYCALVVITQFLTNTPMALTALQSAYVALAGASLVNAYVALRWLARRRAHTPGNSTSSQRSETAWVYLLALGTFVLCVLPLWSYGFTTIIGENWDAEIYMGLGAYLKAYPQTGLSHVLPNPILDTLINPPYSLRTHGFSYFQAALGFLPFDSLRTLAPLLALIRALSISAAYLFFRVGLHFKERTSLAACLALALNPFLAWVTYNTFGMQVPALGLLPLSVCLTILAVRTAAAGKSILAASSPTWWAGLLIAGMAVTYHPALTAYIAMVGPVVLAALIRGRSMVYRRQIILSAGMVAVLGIALSLVSQLKSFEGFLKQYSEKTAGLGLTGFTSPADAFGFSLSFRDLIPAVAGRPLLSLLSRAYVAWGWVAFVLAMALAGFYLWQLWARGKEARQATWEQIALVAGAIVYVLLFLRPLNYPYGWFKALTFVSFVFIGTTVAGLAWLFGAAPELAARPPAGEEPRRGATLWRKPFATPFGLGLIAALLIPLIVTLWFTVGMYWEQPIRFDRAMLDVGAIRPIVTADADRSVYISNSPNMQKLGRLYNGLLSYFLIDTDLYGSFQTANSKLDRTRADGLYHYSLLNSGDSPSEYGVASYDLVWHNSLMSLYASPPAAELPDLFHHNYLDEGKYPAVAPGKPLMLEISPASISMTSTNATAGLPITDSGKTGNNRFSLGLATLVTSTLTMTWSTGVEAHTEQQVITPGYTTYRSPVLPFATGNVWLTASSGEGVYVRWSHLAASSGNKDQATGISPDGQGLIAIVGSSTEGGDIALDVGYLNNRPRSTSLTQTLSLDIYGTGKSQGLHYGYWNFQVPYGKASKLLARLDAGHESLRGASLDGIPAAPSQIFSGHAGDGQYVASLLIYENGRVSETFNDIFTFTIDGEKLIDFRSRSLPPLFR